MDPELQAFLASLMGQQADPMSTASDMPAYGPSAPQAAPGGPTYAPAAQQAQADPREALLAALFAPPPEQQTEPKWKTMGKGGKAGMILAALGDVANVLQRQSAKGARTFAPSNYTGQFLAGEHQKLQEKNQMANRADQLKRAKMAHELDRMDKADAERRQIEREALYRAMSEATSLQEAQQVGARAGISGASNMTRAQLNEALSAKAQIEDAGRKTDRDRAYEFQQQTHADLQAQRSQANADREAGQAAVDKVEQRAIGSEQRRAIKGIRGLVMDSRNSVLDEIEAGTVNPQREYSRLKRQLEAHIEAQGLDPEGRDEVDQLFEQQIGDLLRTVVSQSAEAQPPTGGAVAEQAATFARSPAGVRQSLDRPRFRGPMR